MRRRDRRPDVDTQLDEVYARIPPVACRGLCQDSCGSVAMTPLEQRRITQRHGVELPLAAAPALRTDRSPLGLPINHRCAALDTAGRCTVYPDRPAVCRLWGAVEQMRCPHGCEPPDGMMAPHAARLTLARISELSDRAGRL